MSKTTPFKSSIDFSGLGDALRAYRIGACLQAEDVATKLGVSRAAVYRMEKGEIVKIETLERVAGLLDISLASLLGIQVEYYANALGLFERMRQIEQRASQIFVHFEPVSLLLTSDEYLDFLHDMLLEASPRGSDDTAGNREIEKITEILAERRRFFNSRQPQIVGLIGMRGLERFLQIGMVGHVFLPDRVRRHRIEMARREVGRIADLMTNEPLNIRIGIIDDAMPASTFELFSGANGKAVAVSPFRLGELPNIRNGIATVTRVPEAVDHYEKLISRLWDSAYKGERGAELLKDMLRRFATAHDNTDVHRAAS